MNTERSGPSSKSSWTLSWSKWHRYVVAFLAVGFGWAGREALDSVWGPTALRFIFFFPAVAVSTWFGRAAAGLLAILLSSAVSIWFFVEPRHSFAVSHPADLLAVLSFCLASGLIVGAIESMHRAKARALVHQKALAESEQLFRALVHASSQTVWHYRPGGEPIRQISEGSAAWWREFTGQSEEERSAEGGKGWLSAVHEADRETAQRMWHQITSLEPIQVHYRVRRRDGAWRWLRVQGVPLKDESGAATSVAGVIVDVTDQKLAEERFRLAVESAPNAMIMVNQSGTIVLANTQTEKLFGYSREELIGRPLEMLLPERYRAHHPSYRATFFATPQSRAMGLGRDLFAVRKDGTEILVEVGLNPMKTDEGHFVLAAVVDVTKRKQLQADLEEAVRQRDRFLAILGHELRNPIAAVRLANDILQRIGGGDEAANQQREIIRRKTKHVARLIDDLLDVARVASGRIVLQREPLDLGRVAERCVASHADPARSRNVRLLLESSDEPLAVYGDSVRLDQILSNLITNAIKYNRSGGEVRVTLKREGGWGIVKVRDTGIGMSPELQSRIFQMFVQGESKDLADGGLGIGLSLARSMAELHGGSLTAASPGPDQGSEFTLRLPLSRVEPPAKEETRLARPAAGRQPILVVEDDAEIRSSLEYLLTDSGFSIHTAADGEAGLEQAKAVRPVVMLIDVGLPKIDGYELAKRVRALFGGSIRLVALTGYGTVEDRRRALQSGFDEHVAKPVDIDKLEHLLATYTSAAR